MPPSFRIDLSRVKMSVCKLSSCKNHIVEGELRIGKGTDNHSFHWYHYKCGMKAFEGARASTVIPMHVREFHGIDDLTAADQQQVMRDLEDVFIKRATGIPAPKKTRKTKKPA